MGSRGSDYRRRENVLDLYKVVDAAYDKAYGENGTHSPADVAEWQQQFEKLNEKGLADDYLAWLVSGSPSEWTPTTKNNQPEEENNEPEQENTAEPEPELQTNSNPLAERMGKASYAKTPKEAEDHLLPELQRVWPTLTDEEKIVLRSYSGKLAGELNTYLWKGTEVHGGFDNITDTYYNGDIQQPLDLLTGALNKSSLPEDTWLERGVDQTQLLNFLGISNISEIADVIDEGRIVTHKGFMSTSSGDFASYAKSEQVLLKVFAPKGTPGMYIQPISKFGDHHLKVGYSEYLGFDKKAHKVPKIEQDWDGKTTWLHGSEHETLLQRGLPFKVMGQEKTNGKLVVTIAVVE